MTFSFQAEKENLKNDGAALPPLPPTVVTVHGRRKRGQCYSICVLLFALFILVTGVFGGIYLYKHLAHKVFYCSITK